MRFIRRLISNRRRLAMVACLIVASGIAAAVAFAGPQCGYVTESQYRRIAIGMSRDAVIGMMGFQPEFEVRSRGSFGRCDIYEGVEGRVILFLDPSGTIDGIHYDREPFWQLWSKRVYDKLVRIWVGNSTTV